MNESDQSGPNHQLLKLFTARTAWSGPIRTRLCGPCIAAIAGSKIYLKVYDSADEQFNVTCTQCSDPTVSSFYVDHLNYVQVASLTNFRSTYTFTNLTFICQQSDSWAKPVTGKFHCTTLTFFFLVAWLSLLFQKM